jgi:HEPN superfamily AbiU2-like protein
VRAAVEEYDFVVACHETWRLAAHDKALHARIGHSFAGNTFLMVRSVLRREMLLALSRLWDTDSRALGMSSIADDLSEPIVMNALWPSSVTHTEPRRMATKAVQLIRKYQKGGANHATLRTLTKIRNQHLAHHQIKRSPIVVGTVEEEALGNEIAVLYDDMATLISLLEHVVERTAYNPKDTAEVYTFYAKFFWEAVRGERTPRHPNSQQPAGTDIP